MVPEGPGFNTVLPPGEVITRCPSLAFPVAVWTLLKSTEAAPAGLWAQPGPGSSEWPSAIHGPEGAGDPLQLLCVSTTPGPLTPEEKCNVSI
jgi:hypothetical protein